MRSYFEMYLGGENPLVLYGKEWTGFPDTFSGEKNFKGGPASFEEESLMICALEKPCTQLVMCFDLAVCDLISVLSFSNPDPDK